MSEYNPEKELWTWCVFRHDGSTISLALDYPPSGKAIGDRIYVYHTDIPPFPDCAELLAGYSICRCRRDTIR